jgi:two-component system sensor histidine kinase HydH
MESAQQPGIDYLIVTDLDGTILADSDPSRLGMGYGLDLDLPEIFRSEALGRRQVPNSEGADSFEVYRRFAPTDDRFPGFPDPMLAPPPPPGPPEEAAKASPGMVIFVGLDMGPIEEAHAEDISHTIWMAVLFLLIGCSGVISLLLAQGYRAARSSLSRIKAFSDSLVENMPIGLVAADGKGVLIAFNQTAEEILGRSSGEALGRKAEEILPGSCREIFRTLAEKGGLIEREIDCTVAEGKTIPLEVIATALSEEDGTFVGHVLLFRDLTEMRRLKQEVARSQRLASLGSLAAGVAHEIRNPLSSIKGFATYFRERYRENAADRETAEVMIREVDRINRVITQLLEFARPMTMHRTPASLQSLIRHSLKTVVGQARDKGVLIESDLPPEIGPVSLDADRIDQVLLNLFLNSLAAMETGGILRVSMGRAGRQTIRIDIADTGAGIRKEDLQRVFDPYFTTKPSGTGLGLAIVHRIVEAHGGEIRIESEPGRGTTVTLLLPEGPLFPGPAGGEGTPGAPN